MILPDPDQAIVDARERIDALHKRMDAIEKVGCWQGLDLATRFGVDPATLGRARRGLTWRHV